MSTAPHRIEGDAPAAFTKVRDSRARLIETIVVVLMIVVPTIGAACGVARLLAGRLAAHDHVLFALMYVATGLGITLGYHRYFSHRAFETSTAMRNVLAIAGACAVQGPVIRWVGDHRRHHAFTDVEGDPHSPVEQDRRLIRGLWHSHIGWLFDREKTAVRRYAADLIRDKHLTWIDRKYVVWVSLSLAIPAAAGFAITGTASGAINGFLWAGLTRVFCVQHVTWSINSIGHVFGQRPHQTGDYSSNHRILAFLSLGEGWHNNHHAEPSSAIHGLRRGEFDFSAVVLRTLERFGIVWAVRYPTIEP